jgi:hypothetical protein
MTPIPVLCCVTIKESVPAGNPLIGNGFLAMPALRALLHHMLPDNPTRITPAFLMPVLRSAGVLQQATITKVDAKPLAGGAGFNAQLACLYLTYDRHEAKAPRSLIAKLPTLQIELQQNAAVFRPGMRECWFYRHGTVRTPLNVPRCFYNAVDAATGESFLLLEDLTPGRTGNRMDGASIEEAKLALQSLAALHAAWWEVDPVTEPELLQLMDNAQEAQNLVGQLYQKAWPQFLERFAFQIPDEVRQLGGYLVGHIPEAEALLDPSPRTLIHGDFRLENMIFGTRDGQPVCWVIDWEDVILWNGMFDVAWFLGGCLPVEKSDQEEELLRWYYQALTQAGVKGYPWAQCYHDYRCAMLSGFVQGVLSVASLETDNDDDRDLARVLAERFIMACVRLRLFERLPSSIRSTRG